MASVTLEQLKKHFPSGKGESVRAVDGVDLDIADGELMALVGPSGCGKTTLLRLIAGLEEITAGRILLDGQEVNRMRPQDRDVAMVFQNYALFPHLNVRQNMAFGLKFRKVTKAEIARRVNEAAEILGLGDLLRRRPAELSGGQRQRVAVGRAIVCKPRVFLFDEPLSNLDARMRARMRGELARLHRQLQATMIFVTHDQSEAMTLGQRICVLDQGRVMQAGKPMELYDQPCNKFVGDFLGSPSMGFIRGRIEKRKGLLWFNDLQYSTGFVFELPGLMSAPLKAWEGKIVELGLRPEQLRLAIGDETANGMFSATVANKETLGYEALLYIDTGAHSLAVRVDGAAAANAGDKVRLIIDAGQASWFDPDTGEAIV